jgi:hypothetical protein
LARLFIHVFGSVNHVRETQTTVVVFLLQIDLSFLISVVLTLKLKCAAMVYSEVASGLQSPFVVLHGTRHFGSNLHPIRHFLPAAIVVPHQKSTVFIFDFLYDIPGDLHLRIGCGKFVVFLVSRFDQTTEHRIAGMTQIRVFASENDIVHVWTVDCEVNIQGNAALGIGTPT